MNGRNTEWCSREKYETENEKWTSRRSFYQNKNRVPKSSSILKEKRISAESPSLGSTPNDITPGLYTILRENSSPKGLHSRVPPKRN